MVSLEVSFEKYEDKISEKYNTEPDFMAYVDASDAFSTELENELGDQNGWTYQDEDGTL